LCDLELWMTKKFGCSPLQYQLFEENIRTHGYTSFGIKYSVKGTRKSGDPFTSVYNSILNGLMHIYVVVTQTGKRLQDVLEDVKMVVQGDDNLLRHYGPKLDFRATIMNLGFDSESIYCESYYDAEFCSSIFYDTADGPILGPKIGRVLTKMGYFINPPVNEHPLAVLRGVALGLELASSYVPLLKEIVERVLYLTRWHNPVYLKTFNLHTLKTSYHVPASDYALFNRYGLSPHMVDDVRATVSKLRVGSLLDDPYLWLLLDRDTDAGKTIFIHN